MAYSVNDKCIEDLAKLGNAVSLKEFADCVDESIQRLCRRMENHRDLEREIDYFVRESRSLESIQSESQSFSDATEDLIQTISAIVLYRVSARLNGSEFLEFLESFSDAKSLSSDKRSIFVERLDQWDFALEMLKDALDSANDSRWHYRDFQWRLDIAISSKSTREIFKPIVNAALKIQQPSANKDAQTQLFEMDLSFLRNLEHVLEDAVQAAGSKEARRGARIGI